MAHPADAPNRMPDRNGDAGTEQGEYPDVAAAEVELARGQKNIERNGIAHASTVR
jgi:hypothetical protein